MVSSNICYSFWAVHAAVLPLDAVGRVQLHSRELERASLDLLSCPRAVTLLDMRDKHTSTMLLVHGFFAPLLFLFKVI